MSFLNILSKYSSSDTSYGTDKNTTHSYGIIYEDLFENYRQTADSILEIGFDCGASLQVYSEYFENAKIYGIDIRDNMNNIFKENPKITTVIGDATEQKIIDYFDMKFDIIIEDGSHTLEHQIKHFIDFNSKVKNGGLYIIEDVHEINSEKLDSGLRDIAKENGFLLNIIDTRHIKNRFDDILFVFKKN